MPNYQLGGVLDPSKPLKLTNEVLATRSVKVNSTTTGDGIGYDTGAGGVVTQITSKATGVTLNKLCGAITTHDATLNAAAEVSFLVTNALCRIADVPVVALRSGGTASAYVVGVTAVANGSFTITLGNTSAGNLGEALVLNFAIIKAVAA